MWKKWAVLEVAGLLPQITSQEITDFEYFFYCWTSTVSTKGWCGYAKRR